MRPHAAYSASRLTRRRSAAGSERHAWAGRVAQPGALIDQTVEQEMSESKALSPPSPEEFREVIGHLASGVTVITAGEGDERVGTTASAVCSVSVEPPMVLICMNRASATGAVVERTEAFAVNILSALQRDLALRFATKLPDKFATVRYRQGEFGCPLLEASLACLECRVTERVTGGTHTVFLAEVQNASAGSGAPLAYYRGGFGRIAFGRADRPGVLHDMQEARTVIELGVAADAIGTLNEEQLGELRRAWDIVAALALECAARRADLVDVLQADGEFRQCVVGLCGSAAVLTAYEQEDPVAALPPGALMPASTTPVARLLEDGEALVDAYAAADLEAARVAIKAHGALSKALLDVAAGDVAPSGAEAGATRR